MYLFNINVNYYCNHLLLLCVRVAQACPEERNT